MAYHISAYLEFLPINLLHALEKSGEVIDAVPGLTMAVGLKESFPDIESDDALNFVRKIYLRSYIELDEILKQRKRDRHFIDTQTKTYVEDNKDLDFHSPEYKTVIGQKNNRNQLVVGPHEKKVTPEKVFVPLYMRGAQVTLFGPPDSQKLSINAMNAFHRRLPKEPLIVQKLVEEFDQEPRWGADNEDSKTPIMVNFLHSCRNLMGCFNRTISFEDPRTKKKYTLEKDHLSHPIKRIPGLALPDGNHLIDGNPLPLHLYDFVMHMFHNWERPEALVFYIPKLENEKEAAYLKSLIEITERELVKLHPSYLIGSVKLFIVFENPRAIFRIQEIAQTLSPYFLGGSLGWHDFLASTARMFKHDPRYRIPVKADPNIVINHIRESHEILVDALLPLDAIKIGGMYGILYEAGKRASFEVCMVGYVRDVITQMKRGLDGFWVAHPDFVRPGLALVYAFQKWKANPEDSVLFDLIEALIPNEAEHRPLIAFVKGKDVEGLSKSDPLYQRGVLAADLEISDFIRNDDPEEISYNIFQALQYLADWLSGNGCVALPASMKNASGEDVFVRVMDDLATTERSRWELWAEVFHGRVSAQSFEEILAKEIQFIQNDDATKTKRVQVKWQGAAAKWYPIAIKILRVLVLSKTPVEFAPELLLPFTFDFVRDAASPWETVVKLCPGKFDY